MADYEIQEFDLEDLLDSLQTNVKEDVKSFEDIVNLDGAIGREIYLGSIDYGTGSTVEGLIRFWNNWDERKNIPAEERKPIKIYIDSPGGSLTDTFTMIDAIERSKTPIWTIVTGCAYSGGFFTCISGHKRLGYKHSSYLFHQGSTGSSGTASQFENYTAFYKKQLEQLKDHTLKFTNLDEDWYNKNGKEDMWFSAEEALEAGIIDEII